MKSALPRTKFLAIGIAVAITAIPSAFAGQKEITAIEGFLGGPIASANEIDLTNAVFAAIDGTKLSPTVLAGEALKGSGDPDFGAFFGTAAFANTTSTRIGDKNKFAAGAAVSASTGKTANATQVPAFAKAFFTTNDEAQLVANLAVKSTTAIGAILGGRSIDDGVTNADRINLANTALNTGKTKKASQQIAQFISAAPDITDAQASAFALEVATTNKSFLQKVLVGVTASNPSSASETMRLMLVSSSEAQVKKSIPALAKAVGLVADVEQLQLLAVRFGAVVTAKQINSTAKALIQAVSGRSPANGALNDRLVNKGDEIGEIAAFYLAALKNNANTSSKFTVAKSAASFVVSLAKTMFKAAKVKNIKGTQTPTDLQAELVRLQGNFGASFAMTINALNLDPLVRQAIIDKLALTSTLNSIAGKTFAAQLGAAFTAGFGVTDPAANTSFENGTLSTLPEVPGSVSMIDAPETDIRNG